jgi:hypothetical protein
LVEPSIYDGYGKIGWTIPSLLGWNQGSCKESGQLLFNASTVVTGGYRKKLWFWHHNWLDGEAPRNLAPHLFELAKRKIRQSIKRSITMLGSIQSETTSQ